MDTTSPSLRARVAFLARWLVLMLSVGGMPTLAGAASEGVQPWFGCGVRYWTSCHHPVRAPRRSAPVPRPPEVQPSARTPLSPEDLMLWGTPVVGPSGTVSYQLPPQPLLDLFRAPGDETARAYLQIWKDKAGRREEAFAAMRRVAAEFGLEHGAGAFDDPTSTLAPAGEVSSAELTSLGSASSLLSSPGGAVPSPHHFDASRASTMVARTRDSTSLPPRSEAASPATSAAAPPPVLQTATTTQRLPGQQMRVFYFFSPRCPSCAQQTPLLNAAARGRRDVVGIAMDTTREEVRAHVGQMHIGFPVTLDQGESKAFGVTAYPTLVLLDAAGKATRLQGLVTRSELQRLLGGGP